MHPLLLRNVRFRPGTESRIWQRVRMLLSTEYLVQFIDIVQGPSGHWLWRAANRHCWRGWVQVGMHSTAQHCAALHCTPYPLLHLLLLSFSPRSSSSPHPPPPPPFSSCPWIMTLVHRIELVLNAAVLPVFEPMTGVATERKQTRK
ncbi:hypothetical protein LY76DRAFT_423718 [Colletotrichum caudatum]|nr:hypothetical protein LY76DRAFT_423718 [Colletotrichum caudatum]